MKAQGISRDTLPWKSPFQPYSAWIGFVGSSVIALITGFAVFLKGRWKTETFVASYISIVIFIVPIIIWKFVKKTKVSFPVSLCVLEMVPDILAVSSCLADRLILGTFDGG